MNEVYFLKRDQCVRYDIGADLVDGAASAIDSVWPGLAKAGFGDGIDAAVNYGNGKAYLFKGDCYVRVAVEGGPVESGPSFIGPNWTGMDDAGFGEGLQAAVNCGDGNVHFFKGDRYVTYSIADEAVVGSPARLIDWALPQGFESDLDAVVNCGNGRLYFFKSNQCASYDIPSVRGEHSAAIVDHWHGMGNAGFGADLRGSWCSADPAGRPPAEPRPKLDPVFWEQIDAEQRFRRVMERLIDHYGYPVEGAAGLVGNLWAESGLIPSRIESSEEATPLRALDFNGHMTDFSPDEVRKRNDVTKVGPKPPGIGLAQWTEVPRREGLFKHVYDGFALGSSVLFEMAAQIDYAVHELRNLAGFQDVERVLTKASVTRGEASDEVLYTFERPGAILEHGKVLPRLDPRVQAVFAARRPFAERAFNAYRAANP